MSTTLTRPRARDHDSTGLRLEPRGRRRRPALAVGSLALVVACVAVFVSLYMRAGEGVPVLAVSRAVAQGQVLQATDLSVVKIATISRIATLPAADGTAVVGRRAAEPLAPNTLLTASELVTNFSPPTGDAIVGIAAKDGQLPASGVVPGESVDVVLTGLPGAPSSTAASAGPTSGNASIELDAPGTVLVSDAKVLEVLPAAPSSGSGGVVVSLLTSSTTAPVVASAAVAGQVALVVVAPGS